MAFEFGLTATGITVPRMVDFRDEIEDLFFAETGIRLNSGLEQNQDQVLVILVNIMAELLDRVAQRLPAIVDAQSPASATGVQLSQLARITNTVKKRATRSTVTVSCTGTVGTILPLGRLVRGGGPSNTAQWQSTADATIPASGSVDVVFEALEAGQIRMAANTLNATSILTPVPGWTGVSNAAAASEGRAEETDPELRSRRRLELQRAGNSADALRGELSAFDFIIEAVVLDNPDNETKTISGKSMPPCSVLVVVTPSVLTTAQQQAVLDVIYRRTHPGVQKAGTGVTGTILESNGNQVPVSFDLGTDLTITLSYTVTLETGTALTDASAALDALVQATLPLKLGEDFTRLQACMLAGLVTGIRSATVLIDGVDADRVVLITERITAITVNVSL